jgi:hypothetical protein
MTSRSKRRRRFVSHSPQVRRATINGKPCDFGHVEIKLDGVPYKNLTALEYPKRPGTREPYTVTVTGTITPDREGLRRLLALCWTDIDALAALHAMSQVALAGGAPHDARAIAQWYAEQCGAADHAHDALVMLWHDATGEWIDP